MSGKQVTPFVLGGILLSVLVLPGCAGPYAAAMAEYKELGIAQMEEGDYEGAASSFQSALDQSVGTLGAEEIDISYYKALALYLSGETDAAIDTYTALIDFDPDNWEVYYLRGTVYLEEGRIEEALADFSEVENFDVEDPEMELQICYRLGSAYYQCGDYDNAESCLLTAREMGEDQAILLLGELYLDRGQSDQARGLLEEYAALYPDEPAALARLGEIALSEEEYDEAVSYLTRARETADEDLLGTVTTNLVAAYEYSGDYESACRVAASYLSDHTDEALEREYEFLATRVGTLPVGIDEADAEEAAKEAAEEAAEEETEENISSDAYEEENVSSTEEDWEE